MLEFDDIHWALSNMTPKAVPAAPLGLLARQCHADEASETKEIHIDPSALARA
jgi:hypothetical protein